MTGGIHHASLTTSNVERLRAFYEAHFGFACVFETEWDGGSPLADAIYGLPDTSVRMVMLQRGTSFLELFEFRRPATVPRDDRRVCTAGYTHMALLCRDIAADHARLAAAGVVFNSAPQHVPGLCTAAYALDPDGNLIELLEPEPGGPFAVPQDRT